ncbi:MAG: SMI1/KNR4 family protein [Myxococcales bacterium]|nr:SMI1/KNR4 family protein [Myxococcales bacterium]
MPSDTIGELRARLALENGAHATDAQLDELERLVGAPLPSMFRAFMSTVGANRMWNLRFGRDDVIFAEVHEMIVNVETMDIVGAGLVPFGDDLLADQWILKCNPKDPGRGGAVVFVPTQPCYIDPEEPVEPMADSFEAFLLGLVKRPDDYWD